MRLGRTIAAVAVLTALMALVTGANPPIAASSPPPNGLVTGLRALDDRMAVTIKKIESDELKGARRSEAVGALRDDLRGLIVKYFPRVWGLHFYNVFIGFQGVNAYLRTALESAHIGNDDSTATSLDYANVELKGLLDDLTSMNASGVPPALLAGLRHLKGEITTAARKARTGAIQPGDVIDLVHEKERLVRNNTNDILVFDHPFPDIYQELHSLEFILEVTEFGLRFSQPLTQDQAVKHLQNAERDKESLVSALVPPTVSISATFYPKDIAGACETAPIANSGETCYRVTARVPGYQLRYEHHWALLPPIQDAGCTKFHAFKPDTTAVWHHGDEDGCNHMVEGPNGHVGTVWVSVLNHFWRCPAVYLGTNDPSTTTKVGPTATCFPAPQVVLTTVKMGIGVAGNSRSAPAGNGTVTSSPAGINCDTSCQSASAGFAENAQVTLTATPDSSSNFVGWSGGGCSGTGSCTVTLTFGAVTVMATFQHT